MKAVDREVGHPEHSAAETMRCGTENKVMQDSRRPQSDDSYQCTRENLKYLNLAAGATQAALKAYIATGFNPVADGISFETFSEVFSAVGDAYSVDPRLLRPEDSLASLVHMDSWFLDAGTEKLNRWLASKGVREIAAQPTTISELLKLIETDRK